MSAENRRDDGYYASALRRHGIDPASAHHGWTRYGGGLEPCGIETLTDLRRELHPLAPVGVGRS